MPVTKKKTQYSIEEIAGIWVANGGPKKWAIPMAIVAWTESHGDADVVNSIGATGLWQHYPGNESLKDPDANAKLAIQKFKARGLQPWVSSKGAWGGTFDERTGEISREGTKFVASAMGKGGNIISDIREGLGDIFSGEGLDPNQILDEPLFAPLKQIADAISAIADFLIHPKRLLKIIIGSIILLWGIGRLSKAMGGPSGGRGAKRVTVAAVTKGQSEIASRIPKGE